MEEEKQWHEPISDEEFDAGKVSKLADRPGQPSSYGVGGLSASDLKAWFDKSATLLKDKLNKLLEAITDGEMSGTLKLPLSDDIQTLSGLAESIQKGTLGDVFMVKDEYGQLVALAAALAGIYKNISDLDRCLVHNFSVSGSDADQTHKIALELQNKNGEKIVGNGLSCHLELTPENKLRVVFKSLTGELLAVTEEVAVFSSSLSGNEANKAPSVEAVNEGLDSVKARGNDLKIELDYNEHLHKFRLHLVNADGEKQSSTEEIDLPIESTIIDIAVSEDGENLILTLNNGAQSTIPAEAIVRGLAKQEDLDELKEKFENQEVPKIELAPTLDGNEPDKAPSVQAVNAELANALKCEKIGTSLALTDISPLTHPLKVSVEGVEDLSSVKVLVPGKNLFDINSSDGFLTTSGGLSNEIIGNEIKVVCSAQGRSGSLKLGTFDAGTYYISITGNPSMTFHAFVGDKLGELTNAQLKLPAAITITKPTTIWVYASFSNTVESYIISNVQIELGNTATEYEPFDPTEYPVNADGTVDGIKSAYPSMVLMTNTTGATIKCEYNRDAAKYADKVDGKLDMVSNTYTYHRVYAIKPDGTQTRLVAGTVVAADALVQRGADSQINVPSVPTGPNNATSRKYVDEEIAKMEALLGETIKIVEVQGFETGWGVPEGALPNFYFPSTEVEYPTGYNYENPETATTHINTLYFYDGNGGLLGSEAAISGTYYVMPSGTVRIGNDFDKQMGSLDPPYNYMPAKPCKLTFMIKVGV